MRYLVCVFALFLVACTTGKYDIPQSANSGGTRLVVPEGMSMHPAVKHGQKCVLVMDYRNIQVGDIVWNQNPEYIKPGQYGLLHRVVAPGIVKNGVVVTWITRGDNNSFNDLWHLWPQYYGGTLNE